MQRYTFYLYLETALHVSSGTITHHQERKQLYLQHMVFVTPLLLSAAIMEEVKLVLSVLWVAYRYRGRVETGVERAVGGVPLSWKSWNWC
jgi:hypothetical protein